MPQAAFLFFIPVPSMRIAAAQSISAAGDVPANVITHTRFIEAAHAAAVDLLVFPELSLSGYELPLLEGCLVQPDDKCLAPIRDRVRASRMTVVVGAPIATAGAPAIAAITFFPDGETSVYRKQYLHPGEEVFVARGEIGSQSHALRSESFALAICADSSHERHAESAAATGASLYLASVLVSEAGYPADSGNLQRYAEKFNLGVLMANHGGPSGGYLAAGKSAFWAPGGKLVVTTPGPGNTLAIATKTSGGWSGELLAVDA